MTDFKHTAAAIRSRELKATKLEARLLADGISLERAEALTEDDKRWFERVANVHRASDETWDLVLTMMRSTLRGPAIVPGRGLDHVHRFDGRVHVNGTLRPMCNGCGLVKPYRHGRA